jgi:hypothetical protein
LKYRNRENDTVNVVISIRLKNQNYFLLAN